ncbi:glycosyltransferase family 2 protein [Dokdonella sp.]|uniref:glycosyltransferase family 2 protein n=1 Tax=Dokdonella sp. TaxID=2291710 RepID=UPI0025C40F62|nr:glycosyltransferase family 2 protein [Dokdonella sp.]
MASIPPSSNAARCLAVIPARNEGASVAEVVAGVRQALGCDVLVIDDASSDDTRARAAEAGAVTLRLPLGLGAWGATQTGIRYAFRHGYASVIALDADGQHLPETLPTLFATQAAHGADVVIGTCVERLSRAKRVAWWYLRLLTGLRIADLTSGLRLYDRRAIELLAGPDASLLDYQDIGVLMLLARKGLRIEETPVPMRERRAGHSRVFASWPVVASYMAHTTVLCLSRLDAGRRTSRSTRRTRASC